MSRSFSLFWRYYLQKSVAYPLCEYFNKYNHITQKAKDKKLIKPQRIKSHFLGSSFADYPIYMEIHNGKKVRWLQGRLDVKWLKHSFTTQVSHRNHCIVTVFLHCFFLLLKIGETSSLKVSSEDLLTGVWIYSGMLFLLVSGSIMLFLQSLNTYYSNSCTLLSCCSQGLFCASLIGAEECRQSIGQSAQPHIHSVALCLVVATSVYVVPLPAF